MRRPLRTVMPTVGAYAVLVPLAIATLTPLAYLVIASLKTREDFFTSLFLPTGDGPLGVAWDHLTLAHFRRLFTELDMLTPIVNSVFLASVTSVLATVCCAAAGYALARLRFAGRGLVTWIVLAALIIPPPLLLAPGYAWLYRLGLLDSYAGLILPAMAPAFGVFLFRQATLQSVPAEILQAARIDGCSELRCFWTIALPLVRPMVGAFMLITFLGTWNNFISPQIVLQSETKFPLSVAIAQLRGVYRQDYGLLLAGTLVAVAPVMLMFLLLQREFISGLTSGAVKG